MPATPSFKPGNLEQLRAKAARIQEQLAGLYPAPPIPLQHGSAFQLLVAVVLSAQSTDAKVNTVTPELFSRGPDAGAMAVMEVADIERIIRVLGLAPTKAKNLSRMSQLLVELHGGQVPDNFPALEALPGVGHKTASVVMSQAFGHSAFPVDTHIHRLAQRWGLSNGKSVEQTEQDLKTLLPEYSWRDAHLQMIYFGREHCPAQRHDAAGCPICRWAGPGARAAGGGAPPSQAEDVEPQEAADASAAPARKRGKAAVAKRGKGKADEAQETAALGVAQGGPFEAFRAGRGGDGSEGMGSDKGAKRGGRGAAVASGPAAADVAPVGRMVTRGTLRTDNGSGRTDE